MLESGADVLEARSIIAVFGLTEILSGVWSGLQERLPSYMSWDLRLMKPTEDFGRVVSKVKLLGTSFRV